MDGNRLKYGFLANHGLLLRRLEPVSVLPYLIANDVVSFEEKERIGNEPSIALKVDKLLTVVHRRGVNDPGVYDRLLATLKDPDVTSGQQLESVVKKIEEDSRKDGIEKQFEYTTGVLEERHNASLRKNEPAIVKGLDVHDVLPHLMSVGVITIEENAAIRSAPTQSSRARRLVSILQTKGSFGFVRFVVVLLDLEGYQGLGKLLSEGDSYLEALVKSERGRRDVLTRPVERLFSGEDGTTEDGMYVTEVLKRGHVPPRQGVYVERRQMTERIRRELYKLKNTDGWVLVHGMAGFGKTVLAAEALRDATLLRKVFPGGVNWITVGQMLDRNGELDSSKLLTRIQNLILRLDENRYRPPNLEAATDYLQKVISEQHPRSLLVLDDVWSPEVAQAFAVRCRTMATSRNSAVASSVSTPYVYPVSVSEGFSDEEGRILLSQWLKSKPEELPSYSDIVLEYCRGSPMAIALIGAILRKSPQEKVWKAVTEKLKQKHFHSLKLRSKMNEWNYHHPTLNASIELSVESLPEHLKEYFEMFVVFDYDTLITADALETIWGTDTIDTEQFIMELVDYSLAQRANPGVENPDQLLFFVHDIILDYLKDSVPQEKQVELHSRVVGRYSEKCGGAFARLPNDSYVYTKFLVHVAASGNAELLGDLLSHLGWLSSSVQYGDANTVLANYREFKCKVATQFTSAVQQFELFISSHMYVLAHQPKREDILQLALLLPDSSEVFRQATSMVSGDRKRSWFKWSNKESDPEKYALKLKLHHGGVRRCQYSQDGNTVVSCSSEGEVKLWDASTGMVLGDFKGHKDMVTCCTLSRSGKIVVSSSEDLTVKVWDAQKKRLLTNFTQHRYGVQCCAISPDDKLVLSADIDSCVMIWEARTGKLQAKWRLSSVSPIISPATTPMERPPDFSLASTPSRSSSQESHGGSEGVLCCAFAPDGCSVITGAQGGYVRSWSLLGNFLRAFTGHQGHIRSCVFNQTGTLLATACLGDCTAKIWTVSTSECEVTLKHSAAVLTCDFSPDSTKLITGDTEGYVKVWLVGHGTLLQDLPLHWDFVNCVRFSPSGQHILSAADNGIIKILWSDNGDLEEQVTTVIYHRRFSAHFKKLGTEYEPLVLCYITKEKKLQIVKGSKAQPVIQSLPTPEGYVPRSWIISNDGKMVAVGYEEGMLQLISLHPPTHLSPAGEEWTAEELWRHQHAHDDKILKVHFAPDDSKVATCSKAQHKTWSVNGGRELAIVSGRGIGVRMCVFFKDSIKVASAQETGILIWSSDTGVPKLRLEGIVKSDQHSILCINLSEDNKRLVGSATSGLVMVWDTATGTPLLQSTVLPLSPCARSCTLSPDGSSAAAGFDDGSLMIWDVTSGTQLAQRHTGSDYWMIDVAFSPDGNKVVTLCDSIEWWKTDGSHLKTVLLKGTFGKYIRFSPDFTTFVTIDNAGLLYILTTLTD